jgi:hypothetical protein
MSSGHILRQVHLLNFIGVGRFVKSLDFRVEPQPTLPHNPRPDAPGSMPIPFIGQLLAGSAL